MKWTWTYTKCDGNGYDFEIGCAKQRALLYILNNLSIARFWILNGLSNANGSLKVGEAEEDPARMGLLYVKY